MARKRSKVYKTGDKVQVSLNKDISPEFLAWINKQTDLTNFFLYSAQELYKKTGHVDVINIMPRKIDIAEFHGDPTEFREVQTEKSTNEELEKIDDEAHSTKEPLSENKEPWGKANHIDDEDPFT